MGGLLRGTAVWLVLTLALAACGGAGAPGAATASTPTARESATVSPNASARNRFGVIASGHAAERPDLVASLKDLGVGWVRLNLVIEQAPQQDPRTVLETGANVVVTVVHRDPSNVDTTFGALRDWPRAGFPFRSRATYQDRLRALLAPLRSYLADGRVWVQIENEVGDASVGERAEFWRGTTDQYLATLAAAYDVVKESGSGAVVVLSSFTSVALGSAIDDTDRAHSYQVQRLTKLLKEGRYDAADLHFYDCVETIAAKAKFVSGRLPAGRRWISTENGGPDFTCRSTPLHYETDPARWEQLEAKQVGDRLGACASAGGAICLWFSLSDLREEADVFRHLGLLDSSSVPQRKKPAYDAFKAFAASQP